MSTCDRDGLAGPRFIDIIGRISSKLAGPRLIDEIERISSKLADPMQTADLAATTVPQTP